MNNKYKLERLKNFQMPRLIDSFYYSENDGCYIEYDGFHFEGKSTKATINKVLKYIFSGGEE